MKPNFANETIWTGDNLPVMRGMNSGCIGLIYLDPPFNSNRDYEAPIGSKAAKAAFKDTWTLDDVDVCEHGELAEYNPAAYSVIQAARDAHGKSMQSYLIFMAVRLMEMQRILKPTDSIYLHCDPTASHYLKLLMDGIFGAGNFRNEITWQRNKSQNTADRYGNIADVLLYYTNSGSFIWNRQHQPYSEELLKRFCHTDKNGRRYKLDVLTAARPDSISGKFEWRGTDPGSGRGWGYKLEQLEAWWTEGRIQAKRDGKPRKDGLKVYMDEAKGKPLQNVWTDIQRIPNKSRERTGYPTQKPLALLERIIKASSNESDFVLDPFCGCATTLVAADRLQRQWIGVDISPTAIRLVNDRIKDERGMFGGSIALDAPPQRTDLGKLPHYRTHKQELFGQQQGFCVGCEEEFSFRILEVDHILPQSKGGTDHIDNLQLLCSYCNRSKGGKTMAEWKANQQ